MPGTTGGPSRSSTPPRTGGTAPSATRSWAASSPAPAELGEEEMLLRHRSMVAAHLDGSSPNKKLDKYTVAQLVRVCDEIDKKVVVGGPQARASTPPRKNGSSSSSPDAQLRKVRASLEHRLAQCPEAERPRNRALLAEVDKRLLEKPTDSQGGEDPPPPQLTIAVASRMRKVVSAQQIKSSMKSWAERAQKTYGELMQTLNVRKPNVSSI